MVYARIEMPSADECGSFSYSPCQSGLCGHGIPRVGVDPLDLYVRVDDNPLSRRSALGPALDIAMRYDHRYAPSLTNSAFGVGWQWNYDAHIATYGTGGAMRAVLPGGSVIQFFHDGVTNGVHYYSGPPSSSYTLTGSNGVFRLDHERGGGYGFLATNSAGIGLLSYIADSEDRRLTLEYDANEHVTNLVDEASNAFAVIYGSGSETNLIAAITNNAGLGASFSYTTNGLLDEVVDMGGHAYSYEYNRSGGEITNIETEAGSTSIDYGNGTEIRVNDLSGYDRIYGTCPTNGMIRYQVNARGYTNWTHYARTLRGMKVVREVDALGNATDYALDDLGRRTSVTNALSEVTHYVYDDNDTLLHQIDALNQTNSYVYSADGMDRLASVDVLGYTNRYGYDADHNLIAVTNALGGTAGYAYSNGFKAAETNMEGLVTSYAYDAAGQLTQTVNSVGATNVFTYDDLGRQRTHTSPSGLAITNEYGVLDRLMARNYPDGTFETFGYSCCGMTTQTNRRGYVTSHTYDAVGRRTSTTDFYSNTTTNQLDENGNITVTSNSLGIAVSTFFDELDRPVERAYSNAVSELYTEETDYDDLGRVTDRVGRRGEIRTYAYDKLGRVTNVFDGELRTLESTVYDAGGRAWIRTDANGVTVTNAYDTIGRLEKVTLPDGTYTRNFYDYASNGLYKVRNPLGKLTWYTRDDAGRVTAVKDPEDRITRYAYDLAGRMWKLTDANGNETEFTYDVYGLLREKTYDDGVAWEYAYDANGNLTNAVNGREETTAYTYDAGDRPTDIDYANDTDIAFEYDILGRVTSRVDEAGTTLFAYADGVHLTQVDGPFTNDTLVYTYDGDLKASVTLNGTATVGYAWDDLGRLSNVVSSVGDFTYSYTGTAGQPDRLDFPSDAYVTYTVDELARIEAITNRNAAGTALSSFDYSYDAGGRRDRVTLLDGSYHEYGYDDADQLVSAARKTSAGVLVPGYGFGYDYDAVGNMLTNQANGTGRAMDYNELNQLTNRYWTTQPSALDVLGAVSGVGTGVTVNAADALLNADGSFSATNLPASLGENVFTGVAHDAYGRVATNIVTATVVSNRVFSYDANGNLLSDGYFTNTWNDADRLVAWESGDVRLEFVYDGQGRRVEKREIEGGVTNRTRYVWDGWLPLAILDEIGDVAELQVWGRDLSGTLEGAGGIGGLLAVHDYTDAATYEYFCDAQGNISEVLLDGEHIAASYQYSPFGRIVAEAGPYAARYRFSSKEFDESSGLSYYGYRYYSTELGRWLNRDPVGDESFISVYIDGLLTIDDQFLFVGRETDYLFVGNDVPNQLDVLGLFCLADPDEACTEYSSVSPYVSRNWTKKAITKHKLNRKKYPAAQLYWLPPCKRGEYVKEWAITRKPTRGSGGGGDYFIAVESRYALTHSVAAGIAASEAKFCCCTKDCTP